MTITIKEPLDIGYGHRSQVVLAEIMDGNSYLKGLTVIMRCFDPIFLCPADLPTVRLSRIPPFLLVVIANEAEDLIRQISASPQTARVLVKVKLRTTLELETNSLTTFPFSFKIKFLVNYNTISHQMMECAS